MPAGSARTLDAQVAVVGAGPIGLTLAGRLAQRGVRTLLLEQNEAPAGEGSKAICMQRETLEIWARLGVGEAVANRGVQWRIGRTYFRDRELFSVELPGGRADHFPPFVNISQSEVEEMLVERLARLPGVDLRWGHRLTGIVQDRDAVAIRCATPDGERTLRVAYVVGTDGAHSSVRHLLGMGFPGHSHDDLFLICDIRAALPFPSERRLFFDPPWNPGRQVLVHPQPDGVWRIDWQLPPGTDAEAERRNGGLDRRIRAVIGDATPYELVWMTGYRFHQRLVEHYRSGRVLLAGDAAHLMSPFGARGLNSGAADAENLAWKLALVLRGDAPPALLDTYGEERRAAAVENLAVTDRTMRFMVPHGRLRRLGRNAVLSGSLRFPAARRWVNSGRLAQPFVYAGSPIVAAGHRFDGLAAHGAVAPDLACERVGSSREQVARLRDLLGGDFVALLAGFADAGAAVSAAVRATRLAYPTRVRVVSLDADRGLRDVTVLRVDRAAAASYAAEGPRAWLVRPDGHLAGSLALPSAAEVDRLPELVALAIGSWTASRDSVGQLAATRSAARPVPVRHGGD
jgi:2-polyprenyl-6-methoxyphenol hydroxylase-like FAD-dependent oxidoreductase